MRAATALFSRFSSGGAPIWRAVDERPADETAGPVLASGYAELDRELPGGGWPQGQLTELLLDEAGIGELSLLAPALAQLAQVKRPTVWVLPPDGTRSIEAQAMPYAPALAAAGVDLLRTIFVQPATPREGLWAIEQALRAQHLMDTTLNFKAAAISETVIQVTFIKLLSTHAHETSETIPRWSSG